MTDTYTQESVVSRLAATRTPSALLMLIILVLVGFVYWPVSSAGFVWVDKIIFRDYAWLRDGTAWHDLIFHHMYSWVNYFRPFVLAFFTAEVRLFDAVPGPMHLVSLALHLANTLLVALVARQINMVFSLKPGGDGLPAIAAIAYGLHPALIEPVVWISSQFDLIATFFMLLGLLTNLCIRSRALRVMSVSICFLLAALSKESAASFPLLLFLVDWLRSPKGLSVREYLRHMMRTQAAVFAGLFVTGLAHLALRQWALGYLAQAGGNERMFSLHWFQQICLTYMSYWRVVVWPMSSLGPVHEIDGHQFSMLSVSSICIDAASLAIGAGGLFLAWRRTAVGGVITAVTLALLPALHIVPIAFDQSLYHERYATMAIAMMCSFLPALVKTAPPMQHIRWLAPTVWALGIAWLAVGVINIRVTLPLWSDEIRLWQWVLRENPDSLVAKDHLLSTYIERDEYSAAGKLADRLVAEKAPCPSCMINAANLAIVRGDAASASAALEIARNSKTIGGSAQLVQQLVVAGGQLSELQHDTGGAEAAYRGAIAMDPLAPQPQMALAILLARTGRDEQAKTQLEVALRLFAPDEREIRRQEFKNAAR